MSYKLWVTPTKTNSVDRNTCVNKVFNDDQKLIVDKLNVIQSYDLRPNKSSLVKAQRIDIMCTSIVSDKLSAMTVNRRSIIHEHFDIQSLMLSFNTTSEDIRT
jgi:hypothetical protein